MLLDADADRAPAAAATAPPAPLPASPTSKAAPAAASAAAADGAAAAPAKRSKYEKKKARIQRRKAAAALAAAEAEAAAAACADRPAAGLARCCPPWVAAPELLARVNDRSLPLADRLGEEVAAFASYTQRVVDVASAPIDAAIEQIARRVAAIWPHARVTRFGSFATGLWLPSSDVDVVVMGVLPVGPEPSEKKTTNDADSAASETATTSSSEVIGASSRDSDSSAAKQLSDVEALEAIAEGLRGQTEWVARIDVVRSAKVPVAKVQLRGGRRVDISIENSHTRRGIEASELVTAYVAALPELRPIMFVLKQFLREKALNDAFTGGLSSYAITLMVVFLLQQMEPLEEASSSATPSGKKSKNKQNAAAAAAAAASTASANAVMSSAQHRRLGEALLEFVEFYGMHFCYADTGISLRPEAFGAYLLMGPMMMMGMMPQLVIDDPVYAAGEHNAAAGAFAIARVVAALENAHYALHFHRPTRFTPSPLSQLLHWSGHARPAKKDESAAAQ